MVVLGVCGRHTDEVGSFFGGWVGVELREQCFLEHADFWTEGGALLCVAVRLVERQGPQDAATRAVEERVADIVVRGKNARRRKKVDGPGRVRQDGGEKLDKPSPLALAA